MIHTQIGFRNLTSVILLMLICGCDGYVENARGTGGAPNTALNQATGGSATATGGGPSIADVCNGLFAGQTCAQTRILADASDSCDIPLSNSPNNVFLVEVAIDCELVTLVPGNAVNAGNANGFVVDYGQAPAHVILLGESCTRLQEPGTHQLDVIEGCECAC